MPFASHILIHNSPTSEEESVDCCIRISFKPAEGSCSLSSGVRWPFSGDTWQRQRGSCKSVTRSKSPRPDSRSQQIMRIWWVWASTWKAPCKVNPWAIYYSSWSNVAMTLCLLGRTFSGLARRSFLLPSGLSWGVKKRPHIGTRAGKYQTVPPH